MQSAVAAGVAVPSVQVKEWLAIFTGHDEYGVSLFVCRKSIWWDIWWQDAID